ncbi:MAG: SUF system NifU family Fe-S cluster assembly protein [Balneolales bacterium]
MIQSRTKQLYQELLLDHNKNPRNFRVIDPADHEAVGHNPLCGDKLVVYLNTDNEGTITDLSFIGEGCAISKASASMMTKFVKGKKVAEIEKLFNEFHDMSTGKLDPEKDEHSLGHLSVFSGVRDLPARVKCATLAWHTLSAAVKGKEKITTEL